MLSRSTRIQWLLVLVAIFTLTLSSARAAGAKDPKDSNDPRSTRDADDFKEHVRNRKSSVSVGGASGQNDYQSTSLALGIGLDPRWRVSASGSSTKNGPGQLTREVRMGVDAKVDADWNVGAQVYGRSEPAEITARGVSPFASYTLSNLWEGSRETRASLTLDFARYSNAINQRMIELGVSQEFTDVISIELQGGTYSYGSGGFALARSTRNRRASTSGIAGLADGYPTRSITLTVELTFSDEWSLSLSGSKTQLLADTSSTSDTAAKSGEVGLTFSPDPHWSVMASLSSSKSDTSSATRAGSGKLTYAW